MRRRTSSSFGRGVSDMIEMSPEQAAYYRKIIREGADGNLLLDIGYFMTWYSAVELSITLLLAAASGAADFETFDTLCAGTDARVKIERL